jgi:hypothetical protein
MVLLNIILFFAWGSWFYLVTRSILRILGFISDELQKSEFLIYSETILLTNPRIIDILSNIFYVYGQTFIVIVTCGILVAYTYYSLRFNRGRIASNYIFYSFIFVFFCLISFIALFLPIGFNFSRFLPYPLLVSSVLIPESISIILELKKCSLSIKRKTRVYIIIIIILILMTHIFTFTFYDSIRNRAYNPQISESEWFGMSTFFDTRNDSLQIYDLGTTTSRFYDAISTKASVAPVGLTLLDHFGYTNQSKQRSLYKNDVYILINTIGRGMYAAIYPDYKDRWRFILEDYIKLNNDDSVDRIYSNSNLEVYLLVDV